MLKVCRELKKLLYNFRGEKGLLDRGVSQVPGLPWTRHRGRLSGCSCLFTPSSLLVWMQYSKWHQICFSACLGEKKRHWLRHNSFFISPQNGERLYSYCPGQRDSVARKAQQERQLHLLAKPEQRVSSCHLLLLDKPTPYPTSLSEPWEVPALSPRAAPILGSVSPSSGLCSQELSATSFINILTEVQHLAWHCHWGCLNCPLLPSHMEGGSLVGASMKRSELFLLTLLCSG